MSLSALQGSQTFAVLAELGAILLLFVVTTMATPPLLLRSLRRSPAFAS
jgi:Kef-type K+ transport system membrane component KefB